MNEKKLASYQHESLLVGGMIHRGNHENIPRTSKQVEAEVAGMPKGDSANVLRW